MSVDAAPPPSGAGQPLVVLTRAGRVHPRPDQRSRVLERLDPRRPITGVPTVLPVLGRRTDAAGRTWLQVDLPGRPNGRRGWIVATGTRSSTTPWQVRIELDQRRVSAIRNGHVVRRFSAIIGAAATPTPRGSFFVEENVRLGRARVGGPYALALSARSEVLQQFAGGPGQIALHGRSNVGGVLGTAVSHGCIRLDNAAIAWLARRIVPGTRVTITR